MRHFTTNKRPPTLQERFQSRSPTPESTDNQPKNGTGQEGKVIDNEKEEEEEEDDYMNMTFTDTPTMPETSLQRRQRLRAEGLKRGAVPSKAELLAQERARREEGLAKSLLHTDPGGAAGSGAGAAASIKKSKGLAMMAKMGFKPGSKLGVARKVDGGSGEEDEDDTRVAEPLRIEVREDRGGIGLEGERKRKLQEAAAAEGVDLKKPRVAAEVDPIEYRDRMARERDAARKETLVGAAQKIAERMDEDRAAGVVEEDDEAERERKRKAGVAAASRPLKAVPVLYRGLVRHREEKERDRRMRHDLETSMGTLSAKLPAYEDEGMDADDKMALGREEKKTVYMVADDLDEDDEELNEWEAREVDDRLKLLVDYLRKEYRYCFWCKFAYPDESMEGCPGLTEEDHD
ncbi:hypothetical protein N0V82_003217 [Gnomoniopsis sp. IMI 355080]|nr:hypothetical protein N0V82_003217 [Gnomoniopsis sp. IMI 355080]